MNPPEQTPPRPPRWPTFLAGFAAGAVVVLTIGLAYELQRASSSEPVIHADADLLKYTGYAWPSSVSVVSVGDNHAGTGGKGVYHLVFDTDSEAVEGWLSGKPPWDLDRWQEGALPAGVPDVVQVAGPDFRPLTGGKVRFAARARQVSGEKWPRGDLIAIDPERTRVWVLSWDL